MIDIGIGRHRDDDDDYYYYGKTKQQQKHSLFSISLSIAKTFFFCWLNINNITNLLITNPIQFEKNDSLLISIDEFFVW